MSAASAVEAGARPLVIEKGAEPGGSMLMSGGTIWTAPTMAIMEAWVPGGDAPDNDACWTAWLPASSGWTRWASRVHPRSRGPSDRCRGRHCSARCASDRDDRVGRRTSQGRDRARIDRRVCDGPLSVAVVDGGGGRTTIRAWSMVIATGGCGGSAELLARHMGPSAPSMLLRRGPNEAPVTGCSPRSRPAAGRRIHVDLLRAHDAGAAGVRPGGQVGVGDPGLTQDATS